MNSSSERRKHTLALRSRRRRAARLLAAIANLPNDVESGARWLQANFPDVLKDLPAREVIMEAEFPEDRESFPYNSTPKGAESKYRYLVLPLRNRLRWLWLARNSHYKLLGMMRISQWSGLGCCSQESYGGSTGAVLHRAAVPFLSMGQRSRCWCSRNQV